MPGIIPLRARPIPSFSTGGERLILPFTVARLLLAMHRLSWTRPRAAAIGARTTPPGGDPIASLLALPPILKCLEEPAPAEGRVA